MATEKKAPVLPTTMNCRYGEVDLDKIVVDHRVQRTKLNMVRINKMVANFNENALGVVILSERANGTSIAIDGWHRSEVCKLVPEAPRKLRALIFTGLTLPEEAALFEAYNSRTVVHAVDRFKVAVTQGRELETRVTKMLKEYGMVVGTGNMGFSAVETARRIVNRPGGFDHLATAFRVADGAFTADSDSFDGRLIEGIAEMAYHYGKLDEDGFIKRLGQYDGGVAQIIREAKAYNDASNVKLVLMGYITVLTRIYNKGRRGESSLPPYQRGARLKGAKTEAVKQLSQ